MLETWFKSEQMLFIFFMDFLVSETNCPGNIFDFPRDNQMTDYVILRSSFPTLNEGTVCLWVNTSDHNRKFTAILSYAVPEVDNEILFGFEDSRIAWLSLKQQDYEFNVISQLSGIEMVGTIFYLQSQ